MSKESYSCSGCAMYDVGDRCEYRTYFSGQVVTAYVMKRWLFMRLIRWAVDYTDLSGDNYQFDKMRWRPVWRLTPDRY